MPFKILGTDKGCCAMVYMVKSHEMDSLWGPVRNSGGHIIMKF